MSNAVNECIEIAKQDPKLEEKLCKYIDKIVKTSERTRVQRRAHAYANNLNTQNKEPNPDFIKKYSLYQMDDNKWHTGISVKLNK